MNAPAGEVGINAWHRQQRVHHAQSLLHTMPKPVIASELLDAVLEQLGLLQINFQPRGSIRPQLAPRRLLLAEDGLVNQKVALSILETLGYRADLANNGLEALVAVKRQDYNLIFMDVYMPEMNGLLAARKIRQMFDAGKQPRIIAMTAGVLPEDQRKTADAGMDDFIAKPLRIEALKRAITVSKEILGDANLSV